MSQEINQMDLNLNKSKGIAPIKPEFILDQVIRDENKIVENEVKDDQKKSENSKRKRGQNKDRRKLNERNSKLRMGKVFKICHKLAADGQCPYGDRCNNSHNLDEFAQNRLTDINNDCYAFNQFGKCHYGIACRFGGCHLNGTQNIIDNDKFEQSNHATQTYNSLSKELQSQLRKKVYDFSLANKAVDDVMKLSHDQLNIKRNNKSKIDFRNKLYLAPLTTVGNLPFRRICKQFGADITCGEMALCTNLLEGQQSEWALLKRHHSEDIFGVQICGSHPDTMTKCAQLINENCKVDFIDINMGCPIDLIYKKGGGAGLMEKRKKFQEIIYGMSNVIDCCLTAKMRTGVYEGKSCAHKVISTIKEWEELCPIDLITIHGRSREQRYTKIADWNYINECAQLAHPIPVFGSGDVISYEDYYHNLDETKVSGIMIARGALIKPWIFQEIKQKKHWDITSTERFDMLKQYVNYGLEHWGSDAVGVDKTRRFLLEWLSFLHRYIPVGLLERLPQKINERPMCYRGRNQLETLMASSSCKHWIQISEMLLGKVPNEFIFIPKHKANAY